MSLPVVVATWRLPEDVSDCLAAHARLVCWESDGPVDRDWLADQLPVVEGLLCLLTDQIDQNILTVGSRLRVVSTMSVGYDHIHLPTCTTRGIPIGYTPGILTETTADLAFALLMAAARRLMEGADYVRQGQWMEWKPNLLLGRDVYGATLGIVGFGRIGQALARRAQGFQMKVLVVRSPRQVSEAMELPSTTFVDLSTVLQESDFLSLHVPLTSETHHMIGQDQLQAMKRSSILINTARGAVVDSAALYSALQQGTIAAAALDVTEPEPLPADHLLLTLPNCLVIPHLGSASVATRLRMAQIAVNNVIAGLRGDRLPYCVNPAVYHSSRP